MPRPTRRSRPLGLAARLVLGATCVSVVLLWLSAASPLVSPASVPLASIMGLCFPFFLAGVCLMGALVLICAPRWVWLPLVGLLACAGTIRTYLPLNLRRAAPKDAIGVLSWNVCGWGNKDNGGFDAAGRHNRIARYVGQSGARIVCLQEAYRDSAFYARYVFPEMPRLPYHDVQSFKESKLALVSAFPILRRERLCQSGNNGAMAYWLLLAPRDTLLLINCHLKSMGLTQDDRAEFSNMVKGHEGEDPALQGRTLFAKVSAAGRVRAAMVDTVEAFVRRHEGESLMLMGDFNDTPVSYAHHRLGRGMVDAFRATASGPGRSFNRDAIYVRIDHIFLSPDWQPYACRIDAAAPYSDHYPILCSARRKAAR